ncbi:alpha/beta fold hydrolase [Campylobacter cuniculorum]|uniref:alpha/beta fold hydrolase n=1 Tax=Campylobacter cuniculorum TaxID=374106 RepID=UPI0023F57EC4|nr:alpha/beta hydrolase [Campylobacter cuniculorum]
MALAKISYKGKIYKISYELLGIDTNPQILILHGWGAHKELMKQAFEKHLANFYQIYVDLPGFGNSSVEDLLETKDYAQVIKEFLKVKNFKVRFFMGHSFGGKVSTLLCDDKAILILLSSAGIVVKKSLKVLFKIRLFKMLKFLGFGKFYRYFASEDGAKLSPLMYEIFKKVVDENFNEIFKNQRAKTLIFWGKDDKATPLQSGKTIHKLIEKSEFYPLEGEHFFFLTSPKNAEFIAQTLEKLRQENDY